MKIAFVVNDVQTELATYTTTRLAMAATNMGHQSYIADGQFAGALPRRAERAVQENENRTTRRRRSFAYEGDNEQPDRREPAEQMSRSRNKASEQWTAQTKVLQGTDDHHVKEEESTGFSCARREFDREQLEKLGEQFQRQKEKLMAEA